MITKFGSLYAGHVDMDDVGLNGIAVNDRLFPNEHLITALSKAQAIAQHMDRLGYDAFWMAEHHFQREGYECIPNILHLSVHLANVTERIKFGCGFNITPMWHPLRLASDYAMADVLTKGRVMFGVGRGYHTREVETFGAPMLDAEANRDLFEEQVEVIFKAFNEESFSHHGKHYDVPPRVPYRGYELEDITLVPRPLTLPVECWQPMVSASQRGLDFMAKHGIKGVMGGGSARGGANQEVMVRWREAQAKFGRETELGENLIVGFYFHLAETPEKAVREARKYFQENMKMFAPLNMVHQLSGDQIEQLGNPRRAPFASLPTIEEGIEAGGWICGPPELMIEKIMDLQERYPGLEWANPYNVMGTPQSVVLEQLQWFAEDVMPAFKSQTVVPAASDD